MPERLVYAIKDFLKLESASGILLMAAMVLAMLMNNSPLDGLYQGFISIPIVVQFGGLIIDKPLLLWINDGLMALFFFTIGLELKREILEGELSDFSKVALPLSAAIGGMVVPAAIYAALNWGDAAAIQGWAIPAPSTPRNWWTSPKASGASRSSRESPWHARPNCKGASPLL